MYRTAFRFVVMSITILTANLLTTSLSNYLVTFKNHVRPLAFTILGMAKIVLSYYYAKMWYHIDILKILVRGEIGRSI